MRDMPLALAWFLGSVCMLSGALGFWVMRKAMRTDARSLRERVAVNGTVARYRAPEVDREVGLPGCVIEYSVDGQRYAITSELDPERHPVGSDITVMVLARMPSDGVVRDELAQGMPWWPIAVFLLGVCLVAWGYAEEFHWVGSR